MSAQERTTVTPEELDAMMPEGEYVHTFMSGPGMLFGADWSRTDILEAAKQRGAELSGERATAMKHGVVIRNEGGEPVFVETK